MSDRMAASDAILMLLVVPEPGQPIPPCPWGLSPDGVVPCDGHTCPLCRARDMRNRA